jgi:hypothetical protein
MCYFDQKTSHQGIFLFIPSASIRSKRKEDLYLENYSICLSLKSLKNFAMWKGQLIYNEIYNNIYTLINNRAINVYFFLPTLKLLNIMIFLLFILHIKSTALLMKRIFILFFILFATRYIENNFLYLIL